MLDRERANGAESIRANTTPDQEWLAELYEAGPASVIIHLRF
jgi:hypothetical protein